MIYNLAKIESSITGENKNTTLNHLRQQLGTLLHRSNARALLRRCTPICDATTSGLLYTATAVQSANAEEDFRSYFILFYHRDQLCWRMVCRIETLREFPSILMG
mgnify:CR=1 FL=1